MNIPHPEYFIDGMLGAGSLELLKLYEYRGKLRAENYRRLLQSYIFWSIVAGMLAASGFIAWAVHADSTNPHIWEVVVTSIAARSIVRELSAAKTAATPTKLGPVSQEASIIRDIFL